MIDNTDIKGIASFMAFPFTWIETIETTWGVENLEFFCFYLKILQQIKDSFPNFLTQHLEQPISVHMQKK